MTEAQKRAADPGVNTWVTASAGTGKTKVLSDRVLRLMLAGTSPASILCLTFTRAAAAEMSLRINEMLAAWATATGPKLHEALLELTGKSPGKDEAKRARRLFAEVLDVPGGMKIQTIHAFCQSLLRRFPVEAGVAPHFNVVDDRLADEMMAAAFQRLLRHARPEADATLAEALAVITGLVSEDAFKGLIHELSGKRAELHDLLQAHGGADGLIAALRNHLCVPPGADADQVLRQAASEDWFDRQGLKAAVTALDAGSKTDKERAATVKAWLEMDEAGRAAGFDAYRNAFTTQKDEPRKTLATKKIIAASPDALDALEAEQVRLLEVLDRAKAARTAEASAELVRLGAALLEFYDAEKQYRAALDFGDQIERSCELLNQPGIAPWVLYKIDGGLDHLLVDEAQDTSPQQWRVIAALAEEFFSGESARPTPRTLFVVGDEKQSIFSFQGADPDALDRMRRYFEVKARDAKRVWDPVSLNFSFRSTDAVLATVDAVFEPQEMRHDVSADGQAIRHTAARAGQAGRVELWSPVSPADEDLSTGWDMPERARASNDPSLELAQILAERIARWTAGAKAPGDDGWLASRNRAAQPGDIMVLVRRRSAFVDQLVRALKARIVPVAGVDRMAVSAQLVVMDLMALADFVLLPADDLTLACVLKGPLIGLDEDALFDLAHDRGEESLWERLRTLRDERDDYRDAFTYLRAALARADFVPPFEFFAELLSTPPGRAQMLARLGTEAADPIDEFLNLALAFERDHPPSLQGFLHWVRRGRAEIKRDLEQARNEVRIMTVHGAKGLQAPIVILPDTMGTPRKTPEIYWPTVGGGRRLGPLWPGRADNRDSITMAAYASLREDQAAEQRRLLYVALTRAEDQLYVCGWHGRNGRDKGCWYDQISAGLEAMPGIEHLEPEDARAGTLLRLETTQTAPSEKTDRGVAEDGTADIAHADVLAPLPTSEARRPATPARASARATLSPLDAETAHALARGRFVHRLLEVLPERAPEEREEMARTMAKRAGFSGADALIARVLDLIAEHAALFGAGSLAEAPIVAAVAGRTITGQIDRLLVREDEVWAVDYKTDGTVPKRAEDVAPAYLRQMAAYVAALRVIFPTHHVRASLLYTAGPVHMFLSEEDLAGHFLIS